MIVIGLTGGIATGKSVVLKMIEELAIPVIDSDKIARTIMEPPSDALDAIEKEFGLEFINNDGTLNRKKLGNAVFDDKEKLEKLNSITHPAIRKIIDKFIEKYKNDGEKVCVLDAPVLIEGNFTDMVDYIILTHADENVQMKRLMDRDKLSREESFKRIKSQMPFEEKKKYADYIIDNNKDIEYTRLQLSNILRVLFFMEETDG